MFNIVPGCAAVKGHSRLFALLDANKSASPGRRARENRSKLEIYSGGGTRRTQSFRIDDAPPFPSASAPEQHSGTPLQEPSGPGYAALDPRTNPDSANGLSCQHDPRSTTTSQTEAGITSTLPALVNGSMNFSTFCLSAASTIR